MNQDYSLLLKDVSVSRFAPMRRLLSKADEEYLLRQGFRREASQLRAQHRKLFFRFVDMLEKDFNTVQAARKEAMGDQVEVESLLRDRLTAAYYLWSIRAGAMLYFTGLPVAGAYGQKKLLQLLPVAA